MSRYYTRLNIEQFGRELIETGDLDPIYIALERCQADGSYHINKVKRWLVAYWCFYHAGVASYLCSKKGLDFWVAMATAAKNETPSPAGDRWPRGHERRHFRAKNAMNSIAHLSEKYPDFPESMVDRIAHRGEYSGEAIPFAIITKRAQSHVGFGPWIGFKIADMIDRVLSISVDFDIPTLHIFKDPAKAAHMLWDNKKPKKKVDDKVEWAINLLIEEFADLQAPPYYDRPINVQEAETVLCKWKSHLNGHYPIGNDIKEIRDGLKPWTKVCKEAKIFLKHMPELS